jgi:hypothetical protein
MDTPEQRLARHLQGTFLAFFLLAVLFLVVASVAAPSIYTNMLLLTFSLAEHYPEAATLLLVGVGGGLALVMVGVLRRWRWVFWLVLAAFGGMILDIPATILQLTGILPALFPLWYSLCRMGASMIVVGIAVWMLHIYRYHGVWAMGRKAPFDAHARDDAVSNPKEANKRITRGRECP